MHIVELPHYNICLGPVLPALAQFIEENSYSRIGVLVDEHTEKDCLPIVDQLNFKYDKIVIPSGEINKQLRTCESIWNVMATKNFDRHSLLINLGGGVIGDMGGFCATTYMRGISFVQIPTTLLSQVDASIGGKLGVDFKGLKNFIGLFKDPVAIFIDPVFLKTLPSQELRSGYAEIIKHALIASADVWARISTSDWQNLEWSREIQDSILIKKVIVKEDPFEGGRRKILNFGHSVGHALETLALDTDKPLLHGEAIALGMMCEAYLSVQYNTLKEVEFEGICRYISQVFNGIGYGLDVPSDEVVKVMRKDKKNKGLKMLLSLLSSIGSCDYDIEVGEVDIEKSLNVIRQMAI